MLNSDASLVATSTNSTGSHGFSWCVSRASRILAAYSATSPTPGRLAITRTWPVVAAWSMNSSAASSASTPWIRSSVERSTRDTSDSTMIEAMKIAAMRMPSGRSWMFCAVV